MNKKLLFSIIAIAFVGGLFSVAYAGPALTNITLGGNVDVLGDAHVAAGKSLFVDTIEPESESFVLVPGGLEVLGFSGFGNHLSILKSSILCIDDGAAGTFFDCLDGDMIVAETVTSNEIRDGTIKTSDTEVGLIQNKAIRQNPRINQVTTIDSVGEVGTDTSITIGTDGMPIISYLSSTIGDLKVAHCNDVACTGAVTSPIDSLVGQYTSITIGTDGIPIISYYDFTNADLKVAHCNNVMCNSGAVATTIDSDGFVGKYTSITIGTDGLPIISYYDETNSDLKVAHCNDVACTGAVATTIDSARFVGRDTSITIGIDRLPIISYWDLDGNLKVAHCNDVACTGAVATTIDSAGFVTFQTSITIGTDMLPIISYYDDTNSDLKVAHCNDVACTGAAITIIDSAGAVGFISSITIGDDGLPIISYWDGTNKDLKVAHCNDVTCTGAVITTIDSAEDVGTNTSITIGTDGLPVISYHDLTNNDLKVSHCGNEFCIPNWIRR